MNYGAYILSPDFLSKEEVNTLTNLALSLKSKSTPTHESGKYASPLWSFIKLVDETGNIPEDVKSPEVTKVISFFKTKINMAVFYYLEPGGNLHPHRDLTGAKLNQRIRFHLPLKTSDQVFFHVSNERIIMNPGTMWALDTSYLHSVRNDGQETRIHIVIECDINDWCKSLLIKPNLKTAVHDIYYVGFLAFSILKALVVNSWKDPKYLKAQIGMGIRFIKWRSKNILSSRFK